MGKVADPIGLAHAQPSYPCARDRGQPALSRHARASAVADELILRAFPGLKHPGDGGDVIDNRIGWSFMRLLTPTIALGIESAWVHRNWGPSQQSGFDAAKLALKGLLYKNEPHEMMVSAALAWGPAASGAQGVGASKADTIEPGIFSARDSEICLKASLGCDRSP
jgi:hypothetical protein